MAFNLLEAVKEHITPELVSSLAAGSGASGEVIGRAMEATVPTIVGGLAQQASSESGASRLLDLLKTGGLDGSSLPQYAALLKDETSRRSLLDQGRHVVSAIFGNKADAITDTLAGQTGAPKSAVEGLLPMLAPLLVGVIGKYVKDTGTDAHGLASMLASQAS